MPKSNHFSTTAEAHGSVIRLMLSGDIDSAVAPELEKELVGQLQNGTTLMVIDFAGVHFIASAGLRVLLSFAKRIQRASGKLALCSLSPGVFGVFESVGFISIFSIHPTHDDALREIQTP